MKSPLTDRRLTRAERGRGRSERSRKRTHAFGVLCVLALAGTAGVVIGNRSQALAQERPAVQRAGATPAAPAEQTRGVTAAAGNAENGKRLFVSAGCVLCHNGDGQGGGVAPRLAPNPTMLAFEAFVHAARQPNRMPPYTSNVLSDAQLADIYAFLQTVPKPPDVSSIPLLQYEY